MILKGFTFVVYQQVKPFIMLISIATE